MDKTLPQFINDIALRIENQCRFSERLLVNDSVTLRKRNRDLNDNDRLSAFSSVSGGWMATLDTQDIYSINIVKPTIRVNAAAMQSANVKIDIEPRFSKDTTTQMAADVAKAIVEQWERTYWTSELEEFIAMEQMLGPGVFLDTNRNPHLTRKHSLPQWDEVEVEQPGIAICPQCGEQTPVSGDVEEVIPCASCDGVAVLESMPENIMADVPTGYSEFSTGQTETKAHPFFEFRMDDQGTQGGNLDRARWFEHHFIASLDELELEYPESASAIRGAVAMDWSYPLRWQQTLQRNRMVPTDFNSESVIEQREVRDIFLTPAMYLNHPFSADFSLKDAEGNVRFEVKQGKTLADAQFEGETFEEPQVWCLRLVGRELVDAYPSDFRERFAYITFTRNTSSPWGHFLYEIVALQDIVNINITIQMYHIERNARTSIVYNRDSFDPEAFDEDLIPTKNTIPPEIPIDSQFSIVPALRMSGEPMEMFAAIMGTKSDVMLTTPAMMGQAAPNEPYAAQLLQKQSSLGLLAPAGQSKALAKVRCAKQVLRCAKKDWTDEDTEDLLRLNGEWTEDYIEAFLDCALDTDLIIEYVQGSEIPQTLIEKEVKLQKMLSDLMQMASIAPGMIKPEMIVEVYSELTQASGIDIDLNNTERDLRLAESRYDKIVDLVRKYPTPQVLQQLPKIPDLQPQLWEGHQTQAEFFADKQGNESAKVVPDYLLIQAINWMLGKLLESQIQFAQMQTGAAVMAQAPAQAAEEQAGMAAEQRAVESEGNKQLMAQDDQDTAREDAQTDRDFQMDMKIMDLADKQDERKHQKAIAKKQGK